MIARWGGRFTAKVFTPGERAFAAERAHAAQHLAARFAAKEATLKALGVPTGLSWKELEVVGGGKQPPRLLLTGRAQEAASARGVTPLHLTLPPPPAPPGRAQGSPHRPRCPPPAPDPHPRRRPRRRRRGGRSGPSGTLSPRGRAAGSGTLSPRSG